MRTGAKGQTRIEHHVDGISSGTSRQLGQIHSRSPKRMGWKLSIHSRSQSLSSSCSILCANPAPSSGCCSSWATTAFISVSASNRPITSVSPHRRVSPGQWLKYRRIVRILEGDRDRSGLHQRIAKIFSVRAGGVQFQLDPWHSKTLYLSVVKMGAVRDGTTETVPRHKRQQTQ